MRTKIVISAFIILLLIASPTVFAQKSAREACLQAQIDAKRDINSTLWLGAGCLFGILGYGAAYVIEPSPPAIRLLGKSEEYVAAYTDCYREEGKKIQTRSACGGWSFWVVFLFIVYIYAIE